MINLRSKIYHTLFCRPCKVTLQIKFANYYHISRIIFSSVATTLELFFSFTLVKVVRISPFISVVRYTYVRLLSVELAKSSILIDALTSMAVYNLVSLFHACGSLSSPVIGDSLLCINSFLFCLAVFPLAGFLGC